VYVAVTPARGVLGLDGRFVRRRAHAMGGPAPEVLVPASGLMILVGGILIALGVWADLGALLIAAFLVPTARTTCTGSGASRCRDEAGPDGPTS
jgi:uncharacterized membrane protein YphA (DoxX/SURF4 family)